MADTIRASVLTGYAELARAVGLDPLRMLDSVGIPRIALTEPDLRLSTTACRDLLAQSARVAEDFGLRMSELRTPSLMGPVALIVREQPTVRRAIEALLRYNSLHSASSHLALEESGDLAILRVTQVYPSPGPSRQSAELALAQVQDIFRLFLGPKWRPLSVSFVHSPPKSLATHHRILGPHLEFDQEFNALFFKAADLDLPNARGDPAMAREIQRYVDGLQGSTPAGPPERVADLARALLPTGRCNVQAVAGQIGVEPRTLQRQLAERGTSFLQIVQNARLSLAAQYVEESDRPLAEIAELLGFSALSAFSRWHRTHCGCAASDRRDAARAKGSQRPRESAYRNA
jgi:AraC-like DNA-binding protein